MPNHTYLQAFSNISFHTGKIEAHLHISNFQTVILSLFYHIPQEKFTITYAMIFHGNFIDTSSTKVEPASVWSSISLILHQFGPPISLILPSVCSSIIFLSLGQFSVILKCWTKLMKDQTDGRMKLMEDQTDADSTFVLQQVAHL